MAVDADVTRMMDEVETLFYKDPPTAAKAKIDPDVEDIAPTAAPVPAAAPVPDAAPAWLSKLSEAKRKFQERIFPRHQDYLDQRMSQQQPPAGIADDELIPGSGVTSDTKLPWLSKPLKDYSDTQLKKMVWHKGKIGGTEGRSPGVPYYKAELAKRTAQYEAAKPPSDYRGNLLIAPTLEQLSKLSGKPVTVKQVSQVHYALTQRISSM